MKTNKPILRTCSRGHQFYKSSNCPVCPKCWSGYYREKNKGDFPDDLSAPALRALLNEGIFTVSKLTSYTEAEILALHGMGKSSIPKLRETLAKLGLTLQNDKSLQEKITATKKQYL